MGDTAVHGQGLLHKALWPLWGSFDLFSVKINGTQIIALPKQGKIVRNLITEHEVSPGKLIWFRTIQLIISPDSINRNCACYGIGIENGERHGLRLFSDGRVEKGLS